MVFEKGDIRRIRTKICQLYQDKRVIVAPCRCKLYMSRSSQVIDQEGKTSYNWVYFATGVSSLIYDHDARRLLMTLFDLDSLRLLWMLKLSTSSTVKAPTSSFHVISTRDDLSEHAGLLYESKEVASLLWNTFILLANRRVPVTQKYESDDESTRARSRPISTVTMDKVSGDDTGASPKKRRSKLFRSLSFHGRNKTSQKVENQSKRLRSKTLGPEHFANLSPSAMEEQKSRRLSTPSCRNVESSNDFVIDPLEQVGGNRDSVTPEPTRVTTGLIKQKILSRRNQEYSSSLKLKSAENLNDTGGKSEQKGKYSGLFKRRKVSRSLSEKLPRKPQNLSEEFTTQESSIERGVDKPSKGKARSRSDSLLVRGSVVNCIVETGHMAKFLRQKKHWMRSLESGRVNETDLCVTEL